MKIGIITCHNVYNYGASLQAYALQTFLQRYGHDVHIINYQPIYLSFHYHYSSYIPQSVYKAIPSLTNPLIKIVYCIYRYILSLRTYTLKRLFDKFTNEKLNLTQKYKTLDSLKSNCPKFDLYIAGSDQIWNSSIMENGKDGAFYLSFISGSPKKISYAASFGSTKISEIHRNKIKAWLSGLDAISVREESGKDLIEGMGLRADCVCDPVFLLSKEEWSKLVEPYCGNKYVLLYTIGDIPDHILNKAREIANRKKMQLYCLSSRKDKRIDKNIINAGPKEFVSYFFNADFVVSNSFHATSFSIIFNKQFLTYKYYSVSNSSRMVNILQKANLLNRFEVDDVSSLKEIDFTEANGNITNYQEYSRKWLLNHLK